LKNNPSGLTSQTGDLGYETMITKKIKKNIKVYFLINPFLNDEIEKKIQYRNEHIKKKLKST
jgi:hypothetical protein